MFWLWGWLVFWFGLFFVCVGMGVGPWSVGVAFFVFCFEVVEQRKIVSSTTSKIDQQA